MKDKNKRYFIENLLFTIFFIILLFLNYNVIILILLLLSLLFTIVFAIRVNKKDKVLEKNN